MLALLALLVALTVSQIPSEAAGSDSQSAGMTETIAALGSFDLPLRTKAAQQLRRLDPETATPLLEQAVMRHPNEYVRFRAFVLLTGVNPAVADRAARGAIADRNDRLRAAAYQWFERHPDPTLIPALIAALAREGSEFVRPALCRALAAQGQDPRVQAALTPLVLKGEDFYRASVIRAIGDYKGDYASAELASVAGFDGPLQDDAVTALGQIGAVSARAQLAGLQSSSPVELQPAISAAICLLGVDCAARLQYLKETLAFSAGSEAFRPLFESTVAALGTMAQAGNAEALAMIFDAADGAKENAREVLAYGLAVVALGKPPIVIDALERRHDVAQIAELLLEGFDMVSEDFDEEQFYLDARRTHWAAEAGSPRWTVTEQLIQKLEF